MFSSIDSRIRRNPPKFRQPMYQTNRTIKLQCNKKFLPVPEHHYVDIDDFTMLHSKLLNHFNPTGEEEEKKIILDEDDLAFQIRQRTRKKHKRDLEEQLSRRTKNVKPSKSVKPSSTYTSNSISAPMADSKTLIFEEHTLFDQEQLLEKKT